MRRLGFMVVLVIALLSFTGDRSGSWLEVSMTQRHVTLADIMPLVMVQPAENLVFMLVLFMIVGLIMLIASMVGTRSKQAWQHRQHAGFL